MADREFRLRLRVAWGDNPLCGELFCAVNRRALAKVSAHLSLRRLLPSDRAGRRKAAPLLGFRELPADKMLSHC